MFDKSRNAYPVHSRLFSIKKNAETFARRLKRLGFRVEVRHVRAYGKFDVLYQKKS